MSYIINGFAALGALSISIIIIGIVLDIQDFDRTKGGYEAPYEGFTGDPVDWSSLDQTPSGIAKRGHVINVLVDGTTGMISFEIFKQKIDFRPFSDRALVVHQPREAFLAMGFKPEF